MRNLIQDARDQAAQLIQAAYETAAARGLLPPGREIRGAVEVPGDCGKGDLASSFAMAGARILGLAPRTIARIILDHLELEGTFFQRAEIAGPGFLNFFYAPRWYGEALRAAERLPLPSLSPNRPLPAPPAPLPAVRRQAWEDALVNLLRQAGIEGPPPRTEVGPVLLLREGRPAPDGDWPAAGQDALRYFLTLRPAARPVELDLDLAARQDGGNPLYYVRYTHERICSLLSRLAEEEEGIPSRGGIDPAPLISDEERALIKALAQYPEEIRLAAEHFDPSRVNRYLTALAGDSRRFYSVCPLESGAAALQAARLTLANGLSLLGVGTSGMARARSPAEKFLI